MPDILTKSDRELIAAFEAKHQVTICPTGSFSRDWGARPYDAFELRKNTWANLLRGKRLQGAVTRDNRAAQERAA